MCAVCVYFTVQRKWLVLLCYWFVTGKVDVRSLVLIVANLEWQMSDEVKSTNYEVYSWTAAFDHKRLNAKCQGQRERKVIIRCDSVFRGAAWWTLSTIRTVVLNKWI